MKTIWKYEIAPTDIQLIDLPRGAKILCVTMQKSVPYIYALVDKEEENIEQRELFTMGTGHSINIDDSNTHLDYIGTYQMMMGSLVFHLFERRKAA